MGKLFENFEPYDVQATRREARAEGMMEGEAKGILKGEAKGRAEGRLEAKVGAVLMLLEEIGEIPNDLRQIILDERDMKILNDWLKLAAKAETMDGFRRNAGI